MGSYAELRVGDFYLTSTKNDIDPTLMTLFRESDRVVSRGPPDLFPRERMTGDPLELEDAEPVDHVRYRCVVRHAIDRLDLAGFTREVASRGFARGLEARLRDLARWSRDYADLVGAEVAVLRGLTLDDWIDGIREISARGLRPSFRDDENCVSLPPLLNYMLCQHGHDAYGFPGYEYRHFLRLVLEGFDSEAEVAYDLTDLVLGGWVESTDELVAAAESTLSRDFISSQRVIVLTEGATDSRVLSAALRVVYPHLAEYFHFLDFEQSNLGGGAGALANTVKAFAGAGILNRTVALFDNDAAAHDAMRTLRGVSLPTGIRVATYPDIDFLTDYPTIGPTGPARMNVNGLAGSLELYMGSSALADSDGEPIPVQWKGYVAAVARYQGEITDKRLPLERFEDFMLRLSRGQARADEWDWRHLREILDVLRRAFHDVDSKAIEAFELSEFYSGSA